MVPVHDDQAGRVSVAQSRERVAAGAHPFFAVRAVLRDAADHADVLSERSVDAVRSDGGVDPGREGARATGVAVRPCPDAAGVGARIPVRFRAPGAGRDAVRGERMKPLPAQTIGPFYHFALTKDAALGRMAGDGARGERIRVRMRVLDGDGAAVTDGMIEVWQADASGKYEHPDDPQETHADPAFCGFGRLATDA